MFPPCNEDDCCLSPDYFAWSDPPEASLDSFSFDLFEKEESPFNTFPDEIEPFSSFFTGFKLPLLSETQERFVIPFVGSSEPCSDTSPLQLSCSAFTPSVSLHQLTPHTPRFPMQLKPLSFSPICPTHMFSLSPHNHKHQQISHHAMPNSHRTRAPPPPVMFTLVTAWLSDGAIVRPVKSKLSFQFGRMSLQIILGIESEADKGDKDLKFYKILIKKHQIESCEAQAVNEESKLDRNSWFADLATRRRSKNDEEKEEQHEADGGSARMLCDVFVTLTPHGKAKLQQVRPNHGTNFATVGKRLERIPPFNRPAFADKFIFRVSGRVEEVEETLRRWQDFRT
ncbi:hypothetical protein BLNAU_2893 [Blattamonas nauphoetae]|nr:hypothetical protein BLNAU_2893 [Blattamonas nauphoetae]